MGEFFLNKKDCCFFYLLKFRIKKRKFISAMPSTRTPRKRLKNKGFSTKTAKAIRPLKQTEDN